ncbi:MAG: response regulator [Thermotogae bacterium]|nr:response regulator [Thermotogota bacterium]MCP5465068.1 response regulator [Thermotogota bacterium]
MFEIYPIAVVDDYEIDFMIIKNTLEEAGLENPIIHFRNGKDILNYLKENNTPPCIIILDLYMPEMDGFEFLKISNEKNLLKNIKVVALTGKKEDINRIKSFNMGALGFIQKPFDYNDFLDVIKTSQY